MTTETDPRWAAIVARDATATFFYAVATTGVYCRPACGSRLPRPANVGFHASAAAAERAGFRACKRCRPDLAPTREREAAQIARLCRLIERSPVAPTLAQLADHAGLSPFHLHRVFKAVTGVTPRAFAAARRAERVRAALADGDPVTAAIHAAGYGSAGRFYAEADDVLGMTATAYRAGGRDLAIRFAVGECSLGAILVAASARGVCAILLGDDPQALVHELERRLPRATLVGADRAFERLVARVVGLVERPAAATAAALPLDIRGTAFQRRVWQALARIPAGTTASYAQLAAAIGHPTAARAVAQACGANALAVAIPCHRVVRTGGALAGYRWGVERKRVLLAREAAPTGSR